MRWPWPTGGGAVAPKTDKQTNPGYNKVAVLCFNARRHHAADLCTTFLCTVYETLQVVAVHVGKGVVIKGRADVTLCHVSAETLLWLSCP